MPFKRKSKKVFKKRSRRERSHRERSHRERSRRERSRRERSRKNINKSMTKKRHTRKILHKKRYTKKGGMKKGERRKIGHISTEDLYAVPDSEYDSDSDSDSENPEIIQLRESEENLPPLRNTKLGFRQGEDTSACIIGPDFSESREYQALLREFGKKWENDRKNGIKTPNTPADDPYEAFKALKKNIEDRSGQARCDIGPYKISEFPEYRSPYLLQENKRLKLVVVKDKNTNQFIIIMAYAYMPNYNYTEEYLLKWTDTMSDGSIRVRPAAQGPKIVERITPEIIRTIEEYCRQIGQELEWDSLLATKSFKPELYKTIIEQYFSSKGDISNTVFLTTIDEISHSALANNFKGRGKDLVEDASKIPLVFLGAECVFYRNRQGKQCFIICNLSGHFKTPKERMSILRLILKYNYGYVNDDIIKELAPIPLASASSFSSQDSDERRPDYRYFLTNDPDVTTFEEALAILNGANTTPIQGDVYTPYSAALPTFDATASRGF